MELNWLDYFSIGLALVGCCTLFFHRHISKQNFFFKRAPHLQISNVHVFDDVWTTGLINPIQIVVPPFFHYESVQYSYSMYEKVIRYERDSNGNERKVETWVLRHSESNASQFFIEDGTGKLLVDTRNAVIKFPCSDFWQDSWLSML